MHRHSRLRGYKVLETRFVPEVNAEYIHLVHEKSVAHIFKIKADDPNKLFAIAFESLPDSDCGTPHIMETLSTERIKEVPGEKSFRCTFTGLPQYFSERDDGC
ncbi:MAG: hypothetical protein R2744_03505 [Bacteroidales bacterium]